MDLVSLFLGDPLTPILDRHPKLSPVARDHLRPWVRQIARRRRFQVGSKVLLQLLDQTAASLCFHQWQEQSDKQEIRDALRFAARILHRDPDECTRKGVIVALSEHPRDWKRQLRRVDLEALNRFRRRTAAVAVGRELADLATRFVQYLSGVTGYRRMPVRFDARGRSQRETSPEIAARQAIAAYTDGEVIHLPPFLATTPDTELNQAMLVCYLTTHEYLHMAAGSFKFSFKTPRGRYLFRLLRPHRETYRQWNKDVGTDTFEEVWKQLSAEGRQIRELKGRDIPDLIQFFHHFKYRNVAHWLFNALEDGRLESFIKARWPGLHEIHRAHEASFRAEVATSPSAVAPEIAALNAVGMYATGRQVITRLDVQGREFFNAAQKVIDRIGRKKRRSVYDSIRGVITLYDLWIEYLDDELSADVIASMSEFYPDIELEEVLARMELAESGQHELEEGNDSMGDFDPDYDVEPGGKWFPEWHHGDLLSDRVYVNQKPFRPSRQYQMLPPLHAPFPNMDLPATLQVTGNSRRWNETGTRMAEDLLADWRVSRLAGSNDVPLFYDPSKWNPALKVTLLIDLTISMEAPRHVLGGIAPIQRAIQLGTWLARNLESQGAEVEAYGGIGAGRQACQLLQLDSPVSESIQYLRCVGVGGFRVGAMIRALSERSQALSHVPIPRRHVIVVLTDGDFGYLATSHVKLIQRLHKGNCPSCTSRHRCSVEVAQGGINAQKVPQSLYRPQSYAAADIRNAMKTAKHNYQTDVRFLFVDESSIQSALAGWLPGEMADTVASIDPGVIAELLSAK